MEYGDYIGACDFYMLPLDLKQKFMHALTFMGIEVSESVRRLATDTSIITVGSHLVLYMCPLADRFILGLKHGRYVTGKLLTIDDVNRIIELTCVGYQNE